MVLLFLQGERSIKQIFSKFIYYPPQFIPVLHLRWGHLWIARVGRLADSFDQLDKWQKRWQHVVLQVPYNHLSGHRLYLLGWLLIGRMPGLYLELDYQLANPVWGWMLCVSLCGCKYLVHKDAWLSSRKRYLCCKCRSRRIGIGSNAPNRLHHSSVSCLLLPFQQYRHSEIIKAINTLPPHTTTHTQYHNSSKPIYRLSYNVRSVTLHQHHISEWRIRNRLLYNTVWPQWGNKA